VLSALYTNSIFFRKNNADLTARTRVNYQRVAFTKVEMQFAVPIKQWLQLALAGPDQKALYAGCIPGQGGSDMRFRQVTGCYNDQVALLIQFHMQTFRHPRPVCDRVFQ
jgi:hypothetical protein